MAKCSPLRGAKASAKPSIATACKPLVKVEKQQKPIFKGKRICSIGTHRRNDKNIPMEQLAQWIRLHGGEFVKEVTDSTTHLVCSIDEFKKAMRQGRDSAVIDYDRNTMQIHRAQRLGKRRCHIVVFDWLEDCLIGKKNIKSLKPEKNYTLDRVICRLEQGKPVDAEFFRRWKEVEDVSKELVDNKLYHVNYDSDGFEYKIVLSRVQSTNAKGKPMAEKYTVYLFESHAIPHVYMVGAKLSRTNRVNSMWRTWCHPMTFADASKHFKHFFQEKTGVAWDMRLEPVGEATKVAHTTTAPRKKSGGKRADSNAMVLEDQTLAPLPLVDFESLKFVYIRPYLPRPLGHLPYGYVLPEHRSGYVPPKVEMAPDYTVSFDVDEKSAMSSNKGNIKITQDRAGDCPRNAIVLGYDSDSDIGSDNDEETGETGSKGHLLSRASSHSRRFNRESSDSSSDSSRTESVAASKPRRNTHRSNFTPDPRDNRDANSISRTDESDKTIYGFKRAPTNSTHSSAHYDSVSCAQSSSSDALGSLGVDDGQRRGRDMGLKRQIIEISDSDEGECAAGTPDSNQNKRFRIQDQPRNQSRTLTNGGSSVTHRQNTSQRQTSPSSARFEVRTQGNNQDQVQDCGAHPSNRFIKSDLMSPSSSTPESRRSHQQFLQAHQERVTPQQWSGRRRNDQMGYTSHGQISNHGPGELGHGAFGGDWGFGNGNNNRGKVDEMSNMARNRIGLGIGGVNLGGWDRGFGPAPSARDFGGTWGYGPVSAANDGGGGGSARPYGGGDAISFSADNAISGRFSNNNNEQDPPNRCMNGGKSGGENGAHPYGGDHASTTTFSTGDWGNDWGAGYKRGKTTHFSPFASGETRRDLPKADVNDKNHPSPGHEHYT